MAKMINLLQLKLLLFLPICNVIGGVFYSSKKNQPRIHEKNAQKESRWNWVGCGRKERMNITMHEKWPHTTIRSEAIEVVRFV